MPLTIDEWRETALIFTESVEFALNNIAGPNEEMHDRLSNFLLSLIHADKPYLLASARGLERAVNLVFTDPEVCDFVLMIVFVFFSRWGASAQRYVSLVESLGFAVAADSVPPATGSPRQILVATPQEIHESLPDPVLVEHLLQQNKWLSVLLLIHLFVATPRPRRGLKPARTEAPT